MSGKKSQQWPDMTSPEKFKRGQAVYDRIVAGECEDVTAELNTAYGLSSEPEND
ncbi:hypothetical protein [Streptomyces mirabilis]|uniref:hypothetical protein n=1 Tax=Streptomyces mirabilis TaxID=68239 RepID=UPI002E2F62BB|nr:hypothetical protein [Streptomyces mirabilis]